MTRFFRQMVAGLVVLGGGASVAGAQPAITAPEVPANLAVKDGYVAFFTGHAIGTQNYMCLPSGKSVIWRQFAPEATLYLTFMGEVHQQLTTHFLSANPDESGVYRPTWQHSFDSSRVWGRGIASSIDPSYVEPGAIPWLLVEVVGNEPGPDGGSTLTSAKYIHRVNTTGGVAPATGCSSTKDVGAMTLVPYTADYYFYKAEK